MALDVKKIPTEQRPSETARPETGLTRPFDTRELEKLPMATDKDPPYRPWWAIDWT